MKKIIMLAGILFLNMAYAQVLEPVATCVFTNGDEVKTIKLALKNRPTGSDAYSNTQESSNVVVGDYLLHMAFLLQGFNNSAPLSLENYDPAQKHFQYAMYIENTAAKITTSIHDNELIVGSTFKKSLNLDVEQFHVNLECSIAANE